MSPRSRSAAAAIYSLQIDPFWLEEEQRDLNRGEPQPRKMLLMVKPEPQGEHTSNHPFHSLSLGDAGSPNGRTLSR